MFQFHHLPLYLEWAPTNIFAKNLEKSSADQGGEVDTKEETLEEKKADVGKSKPVREWCFKNSFFLKCNYRYSLIVAHQRQFFCATVQKNFG